MGDLNSKLLIVCKGLLFLLIALICSTILIAQSFPIQRRFCCWYC